MFSPLFNSSYLLYMLPAFLLMLLAQQLVSSAYKKWGKVPVRSQISGVNVAQRLAEGNGLYDVRVEAIAGKLTDHYDPRTKVLSLSKDVAYGQSVASAAIVAHEMGHALQDHEGYFPLQLRSALVPAVNIGSTLGWILILVGLLINFTGLAWLGVAFFSAGAVFALATLPVELNASARAQKILVNSGIITGEEEQKGVKSVLNAAAFTYVAALVTSVLQVLYYVTLLGGFGGRRRS
jgi:uncharacterized protein